MECRARCARTFGFAIRIVNLMRAQDTRARTRSARYVVFGGGLSTGWRGRDWWIMHDIEGVLMGSEKRGRLDTCIYDRGLLSMVMYEEVFSYQLSISRI